MFNRKAKVCTKNVSLFLVFFLVFAGLLIHGLILVLAFVTVLLSEGHHDLLNGLAAGVHAR